ncbi:hypothetical protein CASFOL_009748 [Castilleja foliolosa]|uniref:Uncharacterized protein n=1 Tax=Castilleja foliolosa TaxID=1961234 RepID=A0ABD3DR54_9LAMI
MGSRLFGGDCEATIQFRQQAAKRREQEGILDGGLALPKAALCVGEPRRFTVFRTLL